MTEFRARSQLGRVVVVGGGTAGWMTALMAHRFLPEAAITVVEDPEVGVIGVGEGTTPHFVQRFLDVVGIPVSLLVQEAGATIKNCFRHTDWNGDGASYHHPFEDHVTPRVDIASVHPDAPWHDGEFSFASRACDRERVIFERRPDVDPTLDAILNLHAHGSFALHFDAVRLAELLGRVATSRGVAHVRGRVGTFERDAAGNVVELRLDDGRALATDFVFDCSGLARLVVGKLHGTRWHDASPWLPCDRALPFFLPTEAPLPVYSESRAMRNGWLWTIPVQGRLGCGYVFDSRMTSAEACLRELQERLGPTVAPVRTIDFSPGWFDRPWVHNCVAIGLSSGFLEPLEATSIWFAVVALNELFRRQLALGDERARADFNAWFGLLMQRGLDFVHLHYLGRRRDTPFWSTFRDRTRRPDGVAQALAPDGWRNWAGDDAGAAGNPLPFPWTSWRAVAGGTGNLDRSAVSRYWHYYGLHPGWPERREAEQARIDAVVARCLDHGTCLRLLGAPPGR